MLALTSSIETPYHRWPAGVKLAIASLSVLGIYLIDSPLWLAAITCAVAAAYLVGGRRFFREGLRLSRPLWPFVVVLLVWHLIEGAPARGVALVLRLIAAVGIANLVTMTSRLDDLTDVVLRLLSPLRRVGLDPAPVGFAMAVTIRFTPVLLAKARGLREAWRARSARAPGWRIVLPLGLLAIDDAEQVAEALRARGGIGQAPPGADQ
ncbi:energy-coupling factor transporter transmembrane component T family protein [Salipiger abyssi]|uniref:Biotin transport system permease protein n=1 Tax=Salipiger abyssi TaxID=1250539 RepID=A0A1P8UMR7_9RHOB|nr:energy-coupling factor transporter transmembrane component T [Salipiger abyssi]APZ50699.1 biotin transport system permease protein [Salipiger abyssi]